MLFFSFLLLSTSRDLSHLDSEDIIIHHRETKEQENSTPLFCICLGSGTHLVVALHFFVFALVLALTWK